jgi:hypothetical protein
VAEIKPARKTAPRKVKLTPPAPKVDAPKPAKKTAAKHWKPAPAGGRFYGGGSTPAPARNTSRKAPASSSKTQVIRTQKSAAKSTAAKSGVKKAAAQAAATDAAGGGPEDPIADVAAAGSFFKSLGSGAKKVSSKAPAAGDTLGTGSAARWVMVEFLVCLTILGLGTIVAPDGRKNGGAAHIAVKGSALGLLFFILALMTGGGPKAKKAAEGLGALVAVAYVFTSQDAASLVTWIGTFFDKSKSTAATAGAAVGNVGTAAEAGGALGSLGDTLAGAAQQAAGAAQ